MPGTIRLHRVFAAKPEKVYRAFVESDAIASWLPPYGFVCTVHEQDVKVGGKFRMSFRNFTTGNSHSFGGTYVELVPDERLVYTDTFDDPNLPGEMRTTVTLKAVSIGTEVNIKQEGVPDVIPPRGLLPRMAEFPAQAHQARGAGDQRIARCLAARSEELPMIPTITAFQQSPDRGRGLARDMPVRWALEEVGQPYDVRLVSFSEMKDPAHRALHPFGQIPTYEEGDLTLFESGAIVLHIAQRHHGLLPDDLNARARAITWMFAALTTVQPPIVECEQAPYVEGEKAWFQERLPMLEDRIRVRLDDLSNRLGGADWLDDEFSAGDLLMVMVLRRLEGMGLLDEYPSLAAYVARGEARPAYQRAFEAQLMIFTGKAAGQGS